MEWPRSDLRRILSQQGHSLRSFHTESIAHTHHPTVSAFPAADGEEERFI